MFYVVNSLLLVINMYFVITQGPESTWLNIGAVGFIMGLTVSKVMYDFFNN